MQNYHWKEILLAILFVAAGIFTGYEWQQIFGAGSFGNYFVLSLPVVAVVAYATLFGLCAMFIRTSLLAYSAVFVSALINYFFVSATNTTLTVAGFTAAVMLVALFQIRSEADVTLGFSARKLLRSGLPLFFTAVAIMFSAFYLNLAKVEANNYLSALFPKTIFEKSLSLVHLDQFIPGFYPDATIDEILLGAMKSESGGKIDPKKLSLQERAQVLQQGREQLYRQFGIRVTGKEKGADILYDAANKKISEFAGPYKQYIPYLAAFGVFLTVKILAWPLYWTAVALSFILVKLLVAIGFLRQQKTQIEVERLSL